MREAHWKKEAAALTRQQARCQTPTPKTSTSDEELTRSLQSVRLLKRQADVLLESDMSPAVRLCLSKFVKESMIQANTNVLLQKNLETTKPAEGARATRTTKVWRSLQYEGIMYAYEGKEMSKIKAEAELEETKTQVRREEERKAKKKKG